MASKQYTLEFRDEALKLAERIGVAAAAREFSLYESQLYAGRSKLKNDHCSSEREQEMSVRNTLNAMVEANNKTIAASGKRIYPNSVHYIFFFCESFLIRENVIFILVFLIKMLITI